MIIRFVIPAVSFVLLASIATAADLVILQLRVPYEENFNSFMGTQATMPTGFSVSSNAITPIGTNGFCGVDDGGVTKGGCYAWAIASNNYVLGYQPTEREFTPGYFLLSLSNATASVVRNVDLAYDIVVLNNEGRSSSLDCEISTDDTHFHRVAELHFVSPGAASTPATWLTVTESAHIPLPCNVAPGGRLWIRWLGDDAGGSGSRDEYGIDNVRIVLRPHTGTVISVQ
jgi:hypothetical protein